MPKYVFRNNNTGEEFELQLKMAEREEYLKENPQIKQIITRSNLASMVGGLKTDEGFKENLARLAASHPTSELASEYGSKSVTDFVTTKKGYTTELVDFIQKNSSEPKYNVRGGVNKLFNDVLNFFKKMVDLLSL